MSGVVDVAVIGLGPTGAILSTLLGRSGINTVVIDKPDDIFPLPRAVSFDHEVMRVIQNLGLADAIQPYVVPYPQGWQPSFMFKQPSFERAIRRSLADLPTLDVRLVHAVTLIRQKLAESCAAALQSASCS